MDNDGDSVSYHWHSCVMNGWKDQVTGHNMWTRWLPVDAPTVELRISKEQDQH